jgi:hypothetical protein
MGFAAREVDLAGVHVGLHQIPLVGRYGLKLDLQLERGCGHHTCTYPP